MKPILRSLLVGGWLVGVTIPAAAQAPASLKADLIKSVGEVEAKYVGLAEAMTAAQYAWRPAEGVRSVREVFLHVASDNYFLPAALGIAAPAETKITATDFAAVQAFEKQDLDRDATIAALKASFAHLKKAMEAVPESRFDEPMKFFGQDFTGRGILVATTTHLHEHLGQSIAYARMNGVKPPWSR